MQFFLSGSCTVPNLRELFSIACTPDAHDEQTVLRLSSSNRPPSLNWRIAIKCRDMGRPSLRHLSPSAEPHI